MAGRAVTVTAMIENAFIALEEIAYWY